MVFNQASSSKSNPITVINGNCRSTFLRKSAELRRLAFLLAALLTSPR